MVRSQERVIITLDRDFAEYFHRSQRPAIGIIYLDLANSLRTIPGINGLLGAFFRDLAEGADFEHVLVIITERVVRMAHN